MYSLFQWCTRRGARGLKFHPKASNFIYKKTTKLSKEIFFRKFLYVGDKFKTQLFSQKISMRVNMHF